MACENWNWNLILLVNNLYQNSSATLKSAVHVKKMGINDLDSSSSKLDLKLFQEIFEKAEPGVNIDSLEVKNNFILKSRGVLCIHEYSTTDSFIFKISVNSFLRVLNNSVN